MSKYLYKVPKDFDLICSNNNLFLKHKLGEVSLNHYRIGFKKINLKTKLIFLKSKRYSTKEVESNLLSVRVGCL